MKYLITGGAGFIGSHLSEHLIERGDEVHVLDNLSTGSLSNVRHLRSNENFRIQIGSVLDSETLEALIADCDRVVHLAAAVGVKLIMDRPVSTIVTNVQGTENVLKLANYYSKKVLVASTSEVYGKAMESNGGSDLREDGDWTLGPTTKRRWAYACSKAIDEFLALAYHQERGLPVVIARFFNTVGPRQTGRYGMVVPNFVQQALKNEPISVHGDGTQTRCFTHVRDTVRAVVALLDTPEAHGEVFNIGCRQEISMNDLAELIRSVTGSSSEIVHTPYEAVYGEGFEDMRRRTPDVGKLEQTIGFRPSFSTEGIVSDVVRYFRTRELEPVSVAWQEMAA